MNTRVRYLLDRAGLAARKLLPALALFSAYAQNAPMQLKPPAQSPEFFYRIGITGQLPLTLEEAIAAVLANNGDIEAFAQAGEARRQELTAARGAFDPLLGLEGLWEHEITPVGSVISGGPEGRLTQRTITGTPNISGLIPWMGGSYRLDFISTRFTTDNLFVSLDPQYPTSLNFGVTLPLLRGRATDEPRTRIEVASKNISLSETQFRGRVIDVVTQAILAYSELVFAARNLEVQVEAVRLAREQLESVKRLVDRGLRAPIDLVEVQTQVAIFEQNAFAAQQTLSQAENTLKALMASGPGTPLWSNALVPLTPLDMRIPPLSLEEALKQALAGRPELEESEIAGEINEVNVRLRRDETRPRIDILADYITAGLAGRPVVGRTSPFVGGTQPLNERVNELSRMAGLPELPPAPGFGVVEIPGSLIGSYGQSLWNLGRNRFPTFAAGLQIGLPIPNRTAQGNLGAALAEGRRIQAQRRQLEKAIEADVRSAMQAARSAELRLAASREASRLAREQYESELRLFQAGTSTVFLVLQRQTTLATTESSLARAEADLGRAIADLQRATATTLDAYGIQVRGATVRRP